MSWVVRRPSMLCWSLGLAALASIDLLGWQLTCGARDAGLAPSEQPNHVCAGSFDWPASSQTQLSLRLRFVAVDTGVGIDGQRVRACTRTSRCESILAETTTRAGGFAGLSIDWSALAPKDAVSRSFDGLLMVDGVARTQARKLLLSTPVLHQQCELVRLSSDAAAHAIEVALSAPVIETRAIVEAQVYDRDRQPRSEIGLEVWNVVGADYEFCADCRFAYPDRDGRPDPALTQRATDTGAPTWLVLTPREALFVARDAKTQRVVSALGPVTLLPESLHVVLAPASSAQLATLPKNIRSGPPLR